VVFGVCMGCWAENFSEDLGTQIRPMLRNSLCRG
jgi:hypothetical protein